MVLAATDSAYDLKTPFLPPGNQETADALEAMLAKTKADAAAFDADASSFVQTGGLAGATPSYDELDKKLEQDAELFASRAERDAPALPSSKLEKDAGNLRAALASSFMQTEDAPSDREARLARLDAEYKAMPEYWAKMDHLRQNMTDASAKLKAKVSADMQMPSPSKSDAPSDASFEQGIAKLRALEAQLKEPPTASSLLQTSAISAVPIDEALSRGFAQLSQILHDGNARLKADAAANDVRPASLLEAKDQPSPLPEGLQTLKGRKTPAPLPEPGPTGTVLDEVEQKLKTIASENADIKRSRSLEDAELRARRERYEKRTLPGVPASSFAETPVDDLEAQVQQMPLDGLETNVEGNLDFQEHLDDVRADLSAPDDTALLDTTTLHLADPGALTDMVPGSSVDARRGLDLDSQAFKDLLMGGPSSGIKFSEAHLRAASGL